MHRLLRVVRLHKKGSGIFPTPTGGYPAAYMMNTRSVAPDQQEVPTEISPDGTNLSIADVVAVAREKVPVRLKEELLHALTQAHQRVQTWGSASIPIYGVTTAFGEMTYMAIPPQHGTLLQENLIRSHAAGGGAIFPPEVVRA